MRPVEFHDAVEMHVAEIESRGEEVVTQAHLTASLHRTKRMPSLRRLLRGQKGTTILSGAQAEKARQQHEEVADRLARAG